MAKKKKKKNPGADETDIPEVLQTCPEKGHPH